LIYCVVETWCFSLKVNGPTPFLTNLVGHEQKKVENPWFRRLILLPILKHRQLWQPRISALLTPLSDERQISKKEIS